MHYFTYVVFLVLCAFTQVFIFRVLSTFTSYILLHVSVLSTQNTFFNAFEENY